MVAIYCVAGEEFPSRVRNLLWDAGIPAALVGPETGGVSIVEKVPFVCFTKAGLAYGSSVLSKLPSGKILTLSEDAAPEEFVSTVLLAYLRSTGVEYDLARGGGVSFEGHRVCFRGHPLRLTDSEYRILRLLFHSRGVYFTAEEIGSACLSALSGNPAVHISNMNGKSRRVLDRPIVETKRYQGYRVK